MNCVVLQNAEGAHLGFMLCNPDLDQSSGDCVFMPLPVDAALFDAPAAEFLFARREAGESHWTVTLRDPLSVAIRTPGEPVEMFIEIGDSSSGEWGVGGGTERTVMGRALLPPGSS